MRLNVKDMVLAAVALSVAQSLSVTAAVAQTRAVARPAEETPACGENPDPRVAVVLDRGPQAEFDVTSVQRRTIERALSAAQLRNARQAGNHQGLFSGRT